MTPRGIGPQTDLASKTVELTGFHSAHGESLSDTRRRIPPGVFACPDHFEKG